jgi:16S rRNA (cytosine1402-N4)-methyltransferase
MRTRRSQSSSDPVPSPQFQNAHRSVLLQECIAHLDIQPDDTVLDATLGGAGHAVALASLLGSSGTFVGIDADHDAISRAETALKGLAPAIHLVQENFRNLDLVLARIEVEALNKALFDLGWSAYQLSGGRGFSFRSDEPLLMTYTTAITEDTVTAATIVNTWSEESLADVIYGYGQERFARKIAHAIVRRRETKPFETARDLADTIAEAVPRQGKIHPATKTFQALRIAVNDELGAIQEGLDAARRHMNPGGRIAVITFHSIEDRTVKRLFRKWEEADYGVNEPRRAIKPNSEEVSENPRARSAKLRIFQLN